MSYGIVHKVLHLAMLRSAALLVPRQDREEWLKEWTSELWYARQRGGIAAVGFALGAFQDAVWLRRHTLRENGGKRPCLASPSRCISVLAILAFVSVFFAFRLPGARDIMLLSAYGGIEPMVISKSERGGRAPTMSVAEYRSLIASSADPKEKFAFYRPVRMRVTAGRLDEQMSIALGGRELFEILDLPALSQQPSLILHHRTWRKHFNSDPHIIGKTIQVDGKSAIVVAVLPLRYWRLPGRVDALLQSDDHAVSSAYGFVLAQRRTSDASRDAQFRRHALSRDQPLLAHLLMLAAALLILPATTVLRLGEFPASRHSTSLVLRRWMFLVVKVVLLIVIVFCGTLDLASITAMQIQPHGLLVGYVLAFRWALSDQRSRCPVCLRSLTNPARIGSASNTFLELYGEELMCVHGHGLLHVPEVATSYTTQRWIRLDRSWAPLFEPRKANGS